MLSWCPMKGALPPGGYESRGGLLPVDFNVREALDFKAKLPDYIRPCMEGKVRFFLYRDPGTYSLGIKNTSHIVRLPCISWLSNKKEGGNFYKSSRDLVKVPMTKSDLFIF